MKKLAALGAVLAIVFAPILSSQSYAEDDQPSVEKPEPTLYSHEESEEGDESLVRDEEFFIIAGLVAGVGTVGFLLYRRGKSED